MSSASARGTLHRHLVVGGMLCVLTVLHFVTNPMAHNVHALLFKVTFIPLILAGLWFRPRVAMAWSVLTSIVYLVHVFGDLRGHDHGSSPWYGDIVLYNVVTLVTSVLSARRVDALAETQVKARELEENARALLRAEDTIRRTDRLRAMGELAAGVAHEIRNPLGGIRGAAEVLRNEKTSEGDRREFWEVLESEITRLDRVVANFLEFARPPRAETATVVVADVVNAVLLLLGPEARGRNVVLATDVTAGTAVRADPDLLRQVLLNLVLNALQAQPHGGRVSVSAARGGETVAIDVVDTGPGVPESLRHSLFDAYVTGRTEGTGLGLAVAARLVETMGGEIALVDTGPEGSTLRVGLEACPSAPPGTSSGPGGQPSR